MGEREGGGRPELGSNIDSRLNLRGAGRTSSSCNTILRREATTQYVKDITPRLMIVRHASMWQPRHDYGTALAV